MGRGDRAGRRGDGLLSERGRIARACQKSAPFLLHPPRISSVLT